MVPALYQLGIGTGMKTCIKNLTTGTITLGKDNPLIQNAARYFMLGPFYVIANWLAKKMYKQFAVSIIVYSFYPSVETEIVNFRQLK